ncbi:alpha/beta hydrolase family protein [Neorhodopirellula pilleata]|uniref:Acetyl esterase Axe7A n=1 Tax=Neorhodopirellula pilleata TaxID=2714738 RepID=A0A5C6A1Y4_9BACT|nr:acetylxylan esterase [Neorhodopirellula pilleata]TWT92513.1 Acetyl esterase Axe7A precursor [Neorhodopirellula pilleata]
MKLAFALLLILFPNAIVHAKEAQQAIPKNVQELWADYEELDKSTPLEVEVLKEWEQETIVCRIVRYQVGVFKGSQSRVAAFYAFPKGGTNLPALVQIHGGGQSASLNSVVTYAKRGYASVSINWGGNAMNLGSENWAGPQTDWGNLDATHPPQRDRVNHFAGPLTPNEFTLDSVESPRNSNWYVVLIAARRAISFLEQQPEVDASRIGVHGHSMGGKLTTNLAGIDKRIKAAVPSCGGSGDLALEQTEVPGGKKDKLDPMRLACVSDNAYIPLITCPILWLSPTNDFHGHIDNMAWNWRNVPDDIVRFSISPHLNHRHASENALTEYLWFEQHLKNADFKMPESPKVKLDLKTTHGVPQFSVTPDTSRSVQRVDVFYSIDPHALTRFWRDAKAVQVGKEWKADCPVMSHDQPIFAFANVIYEVPVPYRTGPQMAGVSTADTYVISSRMLWASPSELKSPGIQATDRPDRLIDDGSRGWHDWYRLNWDHRPLWRATTRKLKDVKWRGPDGATLSFDVICETDNQLVLTFNCNAWGAFNPGQRPVDYTVVKELNGSPKWQRVTVKCDELTATDSSVIEPLENWRTVTEFTISPSGIVVRDGLKVDSAGQPWQGPREIRNLRWEGGQYTGQGATDGEVDPHAFDRNFDDAITKSLE